ncbi:MAG: excisionase family DNA-binding protein [Proteobacteria bacterium]|nr:excisionase family DNA-binding protein [Pseudomonadota bacterium]
MQVNWQRFVATAGAGVPRAYLAAVVGQPVEAVRRVHSTGRAVKGAGRGATFADLFSRWNGRAPRPEEWPVPTLAGRGAYQWLPPEEELLASLVGRMDKAEIARILTVRLRDITGDRNARRDTQAVQARMNKLGLQTTDVVGGLTINQAATEVGSTEIVRNAIRTGGLKPIRMGRLLVIPHAEWKRWKEGRILAPPGYVTLASLRVPLGISSDSKLPEFASMGYIPTAIRCNPARPGVHSTKFGTWYVDPKVARKLVADRHAGRPMPWHGKPLRDNLKITFALWQERKHPASCSTCRTIWGDAGAPRTFEEYCRRYPSLAHGAKRHLTLQQHAGLTIAELASQARCRPDQVRAAIQSGALRATRIGRLYRITRTDGTRWIARRKPSGTGKRSWISLAMAKHWYGFTQREVAAFVAEGRVRSRTVDGKRLVMRQQLADLRRAIGFTERQAAARLKVTVAVLRTLLEGVNWRGTGAIPLDTVQAVAKRMQSQNGYTLEEAAEAAGRPIAWVRDRIKDGTVRATRTAWDRRRLYLTAPMLQRLKRAARRKVTTAKPLPATWINLASAARLAGVNPGTINRWRVDGEVRTRPATHGQGVRFARLSIMVRARRYWPTCRFHRAQPPEWLQAELAAKERRS